MNDLNKYLIGTAAGILLCLLIGGGYYLLLGRPAKESAALAERLQQNGSYTAPSHGSAEDIFGITDDSGRLLGNGDADLTPEQEAQLLAAQAANENLANRYGETSTPPTPAHPAGTGLGDSGSPVLSTDFDSDALASIGFNTPERGLNSVEEHRKAQDEQRRQDVQNFIAQGKSAAQRNQIDAALAAFDEASKVMPDDKPFEASSYREMADTLLSAAQTAVSEEAAQNARDGAETYIKKSLAAQSTPESRSLYANIIDEQRKADNQRKQQALLARQQAAEQEETGKRTDKQRRQVVDLIGQGKNAAQKRQLNNAVSAFDRASDAMPNNDTAFASSSYTDMADEMYRLSQRVSDADDVQTSLDTAERYIRRSLAAQNTPDARSLYTKIADARKQADDKRIAQAQAAERQRQEQEQLAKRQAEERKRQQEEQARQQAQRQAEQQQQLAQQGRQTPSQQAGSGRQEQPSARQQQEQQRQQAQRQAGQQQSQAQKQAEQQQLAQQGRQTPSQQAGSGRQEQPSARQQQEQQRQQAQRQAGQQQSQAQKQAEQQRQLAQQRQQEQEKQKAAEAEKAKEQARQSVNTFIAQGKNFAQRKQLNNAVSSFDKADRAMPDDDEFSATAYRNMADSLFTLSQQLPNQQAARTARGKADEYVKKSIRAKNTPEAQALAAKITDAQKPAATAPAQTGGRTTAGRTTAPQRPAQTGKQQAAPRQNAQQGAAAAKTGASAATEKPDPAKAQAEVQARKREVDSLVAQGKKAGDSGDFAQAQAAFDKAAAQMPAGDAQFAASQYREMAESMHKLAQTVPAQKNKALQSGTDYIKKSLAARNDDGASHFVYSQIADAQNNTALAVKELEAAQRADPKNYLYNYELGRKYFEQKKYANARTSFEQAAKANPQYEPAFFNLGVTHKIMNAPDAALAAFSKVTALKPDHVRAWIETARMQDKKRNYTEAIKTYQKALSLEPSNIAAVKEMAQVYSKTKNTKQAERYFKEALTLGDTDPVTYYNLASVQLESGNAAEALQNAEKAVAGNSTDARFLYTYALALEKNKREKEAEDYYARSISADGKYGKPRINLGRIQLEAGKLDSAEQHLQAAHTAEPSNFEVNTNLGKLYGLKNEYGKSIDYYAQAIKVMPKDIEAHQNLAAAYLSAGLKENARDTYKTIITINPQAWDSYYELGKLYISMDNKAEAKAILSQLLKQKPNYRRASEIKKLLVSL